MRRTLASRQRERPGGNTAWAATTVDILDIWVNLVTEKSSAEFLGQEGYESIPGYLGSNQGPLDVDGLRRDHGRARRRDRHLHRRPRPQHRQAARRRATRTRAASSSPAASAIRRGPGARCKRIRELAQHPRFSMVRVMPLATQVPTNDARHYPIYQVCEELGIPVGINAGIPGPQVRSRVQHPELLEDVLIDFPDLTVIVAHMGHPYEELLMNYMRKWPNLYVSCTAYAPRYMDPNLVAFMNTKTYRGRVIWGSDEPWFPMRRSLTEARELPLDDEAMALFLGGTARRLLDRDRRTD